jgi:cystathionine beta-lyase/cystathionine gamma-synthase
MDNPTRLLLEKTMFELECSSLSSHSNAARAPTTTSTSMAFSSGMQAVTSILLAHSTSGQEGTTHVLIPTDVYHGVRSLLSDVFSRHGVVVQELNMVVGAAPNENEITTGALAIVDAIMEIATTAIERRGRRHGNKNSENTMDRSSVIVWMETPSNPKCQVVDIESICEAVRSEEDRWRGVLDVTTVVDGTMASPILTRPLEVRYVI